MNIVLFGDSHLGRFGKSPTLQLESLIENSTIYNCSAGGFTSTDGVKRAEFISQLDPDVVIFSYGGNDVAPWKTIVSKDTYLQNMQKIFEAFPNARKILFTSPDVLLDEPTHTSQYNDSMRDYQAALEVIRDEFGVSLIDGNQVTASLGGACHETDGVHMNEAAYSKVIEAFANTINSL